jgi:hypothetical protein
MRGLSYGTNSKDSDSHVLTLISRKETRFWFVMRMALQYCVNDMMVLSAWKGFSRDSDTVLDEVKEKLQERGKLNSLFIQSQITNFS